MPSIRRIIGIDVPTGIPRKHRETETGGIENSYTLKIINRAEAARVFEVSVAGIPGIRIVGASSYAAPPGSVLPVQVMAAVPGASGLSGPRPIQFHARAKEDPATRAAERSTFMLP